MTIETIATQKVSQRRDSNSSNGYQESHSEDDGYFTSAVSVQHKVKYVLVHIKKNHSTSLLFDIFVSTKLRYLSREIRVVNRLTEQNRCVFVNFQHKLRGENSNETFLLIFKPSDIRKWQMRVNLRFTVTQRG